MMGVRSKNKGFTLIELSIVLVIIGLIVGGVLVGKELIEVSTIRSQISQIEKYQLAVNLFKGKYGYLPGDIPATPAAQFGLTARSGANGAGDGDSVIESSTLSIGVIVTAGETAMFWNDLSYLNLISESFNTGNGDTNISSSNMSRYLPLAALGSGGMVYVYSGGFWNGVIWGSTGINYFGISEIGGVTNPGFANTNQMKIKVVQAFNIDTKMDDGAPQSGKVLAQYAGSCCGPISSGASGSTATSASSSTCYDNNNTAGATQKYSMSVNNGAGINCALSFQFQ